MAEAGETLLDIENNRLQLEESFIKLRQSLQHWQTWEAEYTGLKEEILRIGDDPSQIEITQVIDNFDGDLLNKKEIRDLFSTKGKWRESKQVVGLLSRRIEYVQENVKSIDRQLEDTAIKLAELDVEDQPDGKNVDRLPLTDIREELDEEGNIISSSTNRAGESTPDLLEALRKAGVKDLPDRPQAETTEARLLGNRVDKDESDPKDKGSSKEVPTKPSQEDVTARDGDQAITQTMERDKLRPLRHKKSVSFAEGTKTEDSTVSRKRLPHPLFAKPKPKPTATPAKVESIAEVQAKTPEGQLNSLLQAEEQLLGSSPDALADTKIVNPVIPKRESAEDASMRRQMLQYNMRDLNAVVAEIELDEQGSTPPYSSDEEDVNEDSNTEEEEDEHGRTNVVFSEEYIKEMQALEKKLNATAIRNVGPDPESIDRSEKDHDAPEILEKPQSGAAPASPRIKEVRFAQDIDVQEAPRAASAISQPVQLADTHPAAASSRDETFPKKKKVSRFKSARSNPSAGIASSERPSEPESSLRPTGPVADTVIERPFTKPSSTNGPSLPPPLPRSKASRPVPTGPPGRPHAKNIVERPYSLTADPATPPAEPDEFDPVLLRQQAATIYDQHRNRMIQRQGGFIQSDDEDDEIPVDENGVEQGRKVSRFRAARLRN